MQSSLPLSTDTVVVNNILHFQQVADMCDIDMEEIRALNPQYKRDIVPGNYKPSVLKLPASVTYAFAGIEDTVFRHKSDEYLADYYPSITGPNGTKSNTERVTHTVKKGETLQVIANKYGVTAGDIKKWNGMKSNTVRIGQKLRLNVDNGGMRMSTKSASQSKQGQSSSSSNSNGQTGTLTYKVKSGDSLFSISQKYPGVSAEDLKKENGLTSTSIKPGQILRIPKS
jgi:membrane-bound lytic murein transglycosylase D